MKPLHVVALILVAVLVGVLISMLANGFSRYETFSSEYALSGKEVTIVGELQKEKEVLYNPIENPNQFSFFLVDEEGVSKKVICSESLPRDFDKSESIVVTGKLNGEVFYAEKLLLKCPSKYVEGGEQTLGYL